MKRSSFFTLLNKYKYVIIIIPLVTVIAAYFLVQYLPDQYVSSTQISTGIIDVSRNLSSKDNLRNDQSNEIDREFSNLTSIIKLKKLIDQVSYQLIIHDLSSSVPFRSLDQHFKDLGDTAKDNALLIFREKLKKGEPLLYNKADEKALIDLLVSMKYDERSLRKDLKISRDGESDFINVSFTSENPELSVFVVNTLCKAFIGYYNKENNKPINSNSADILSNLLVEKRKALNEKKDEFQHYKIKNGILNLDEQAKSIYEQISAYNDKKNQAIKDIASYEGAIKSIDERFDPKERKYIESTISQYNQSITGTEEQLHVLNDEYVHSGFNPKYKPALDSLKKQISTQINTGSDKYLTNPLVAKDDLVKQKMTLEVSRDLAKYSVESINSELKELNAQKSRIVPFDAIVKTYEFDINMASQEYLELLNKYNQTNPQLNFSLKLTQVEEATLDGAEPFNKVPLIIFCGLGSLFLCLLMVFIGSFYDKKIKEPIDLVNSTHLPVLGSLNEIEDPNINLRKLWDVEQRHNTREFKELLRSVRFEIDQELKGEKILAITSLSEGEGKTVLATSLAYSYAAINKKVLLIDGNFNNPTISKTIEPKFYIEDYFVNKSYIDRDNNTITVLGNQGGDVTLLEINDEKNIQNDLNDLKLRYDIILMDLPPLNSLNKCKEWILFANKVIAVFEVNQSISREETRYIAYLKNLKDKFAGWVLNKE
ncbi:MAG: cryptic autophosphorylating protein tyrosine kinase Etk [Mucilaginibacter sp.]|nr:cryptic autophosphorylating protein tyrosine kinase Etk [Mucilaginibacter sp.]